MVGGAAWWAARRGDAQRVQPEETVLRVLERLDDDGSVVLAIQGEIDLGTADTLAAHLTDVCHGATAVTVDLRRVDFIDLVGLRLLLDLNAKGLETGCPVVFIQGPPTVERLFELTGALGLLKFADTGARVRAGASSA
jgi:anti-anti-sigma factor